MRSSTLRTHLRNESLKALRGCETAHCADMWHAAHPAECRPGSKGIAWPRRLAGAQDSLSIRQRLQVRRCSKICLSRGLRKPCGTEEARARLPGSSTALIGVKAACHTGGCAERLYRLCSRFLQTTASELACNSAILYSSYDLRSRMGVVSRWKQKPQRNSAGGKSLLPLATKPRITLARDATGFCASFSLSFVCTSAHQEMPWSRGLRCGAYPSFQALDRVVQTAQDLCDVRDLQREGGGGDVQ